MKTVWMRAALAAVALAGASAVSWAGDEPPPPVPPVPEAPQAPQPPPSPDVPPAPAPPTAPEPPSPAPGDAPAEPAKEAPKDAPPPAPAADEPAKEAPKAETVEAPSALPEAMTLCAPPPPACWKGSVAVRARYRTTGDDEDADLYAYLTVRYRDESGPGWSGSVFGRMAYDLDGGGDSDGFFVFDSVDDTFDSRLTARLYHAWASYRPEGGVVEQLRLGRQWSDAGDGFLFDGAHLTLRPRGSDGDVRLTAFTGIPAHLYEDGPSGDWIVGAGASGAPWRGAEARFDYVHVEDENDYYGRTDVDLFSGELAQQIGRTCRARAWYQQLGSDPRDVGASVDAYSTVSDASFRGRVHSQLSTEKALVYDLDPYYAIAQELEPFWDMLVSGSKGLSGHVTLEVGVQLRQLWDSGDEGTYNREFERYFATLSTADWPACGLSLFLTGEFYDSHDDATAVEVGAEWKPSRRWRVSVGTDYSLYRTDLYTDTERYDSRGYHLRVAHVPSDRWRFDLSVRVEDDDFDTYLVVQAGARYEF